MTDMEIAFSLRRIIAKINESHTRLLYLTRYAYPLRFRALRRDGKNHIYCTVAPREHSNLLGCKLISINGYGMSELAERLASYSDAPDDADPVSNILHNGLLYEYPLFGRISERFLKKSKK